VSQWWSWTLAAIGVTGLFLAGSNRKAGWAIGLGVQALWIAYAFATRQWGFIASAVAYGAVNVRNWLRWRRAERANPAPGKAKR
jgi:hypothetical protein